MSQQDIGGRPGTEIQVATDSETRETSCSPGHVFPLEAQRAEMVERVDQTEAATTKRWRGSPT